MYLKRLRRLCIKIIFRKDDEQAGERQKHQLPAKVHTKDLNKGQAVA